MLSYQHLHHAGNFADVIKHTTLYAWLRDCATQPRPVHYLDTHAGAGRYDLRQQRTHDHAKGAGALNPTTAPPAVATYLAHLHSTTPHYPGSPLWTQMVLRPQDKLRLYERHPSTYRQLQQQFSQDKRVRVVVGDGLQALATLTPPKQALGLTLIDPPYEQQGEYAATLTALSQAYQRWPNCGYLLWYPLVRDLPRSFPSQLRLQMPASAQVEFELYPKNLPIGLNGCGLLLLNAPETLLIQIPTWLAWLAHQWTTEHTQPKWQVISWSGTNPEWAKHG